MNFPKMAAVAVATAVLAAGCRYDKANSGSDASGADSANTVTDITGDDIKTENDDIKTADTNSGSLDSLQSGKNFEDIYTRCTDVQFEPVYFGFDSTVVPQGEFPKIDAVVKHLTDRNDRVVVVEGNCDDRGSNEYNMSLGENRAIIVRNYLVQNGISADRIQTRSYGEERPAAVGSEESAWAKNRRDEFAIFQK